MQTADLEAAPYAAAVIGLAEQMRDRRLRRASILYVLDHVCTDVSIKPPSAQIGAASGR